VEVSLGGNVIIFIILSPFGFIYLLSFNSFASFVCWKVIFFKKINFEKVNYFSMFGSVMKNKLENTFQCLVMSWKMNWKITY